jgi:hypothetical protein
VELGRCATGWRRATRGRRAGAAGGPRIGPRWAATVGGSFGCLESAVVISSTWRSGVSEGAKLDGSFRWRGAVRLAPGGHGAGEASRSGPPRLDWPFRRSAGPDNAVGGRSNGSGRGSLWRH